MQNSCAALSLSMQLIYGDFPFTGFFSQFGDIKRLRLSRNKKVSAFAVVSYMDYERLSVSGALLPLSKLRLYLLLVVLFKLLKNLDVFVFSVCEKFYLVRK